MRGHRYLVAPRTCAKQLRIKYLYVHIFTVCVLHNTSNRILSKPDEKIIKTYVKYTYGRFFHEDNISLIPTVAVEFHDNILCTYHITLIFKDRLKSISGYG